MKFEKAISRILDEPKASLVCEGVYADDTLGDLVDTVAFHLTHSSFYYVTYESLCQLIKVKWRVKKHLDKSKTFYACLSDELSYVASILGLSSDAAADIESRVSRDNGTFVSDIPEHDGVSLIVVNENLEYSRLKDVLFHEIIHFLQWSSGLNIHSVLGEAGVDISAEDMREMREALHAGEADMKTIVDYYFDAAEREAYYRGIFKACIDALHMNSRGRRTTFKWFIQMFRNENEDSFKDYFNERCRRLKQFNVDASCFMDRHMKLLLLYGYFKVGFTTLLNHLLGYFDKTEFR